MSSLVGPLVIVAVVVGLSIIGLHSGYSQNRPRLMAGSAWLVSSRVGQLTLLDGSSAEVAAQVLVDTSRGTAAVVDPSSGQIQHTTELDLRAGDRTSISGAPHTRHLYVTISRGVLAVCDLTTSPCATVVRLPGASDLGPAVESSGRLFVPDYGAGQVWIVDPVGLRVVGKAPVAPAHTRFQLLARDGIVFYNDPDSELAGVIRLDGGVQKAAKYDPRNPDADLTRPDSPRPPTAPPPGPSKPPTAPPPGPSKPPTAPPPGPSGQRPSPPVPGKPDAGAIPGSRGGTGASPSPGTGTGTGAGSGTAQRRATTVPVMATEAVTEAVTAVTVEATEAVTAAGRSDPGVAVRVG